MDVLDAKRISTSEWDCYKCWQLDCIKLHIFWGQQKPSSPLRLRRFSELMNSPLISPCPILSHMPISFLPGNQTYPNPLTGFQFPQFVDLPIFVWPPSLVAVRTHWLVMQVWIKIKLKHINKIEVPVLIFVPTNKLPVPIHKWPIYPNSIFW